MSVADDLVEPSWLQVPKGASARASGQRSAAQNGQDSSLTKTIANLPPMISGGPAALTACSGAAVRPGVNWLSTAAGTAVTGRTMAEEASDSLAVAGAELNLTATSAATIASTAATDAIGTSRRRRAAARFCAARWATIRSRARIVACEPRGAALFP